MGGVDFQRRAAPEDGSAAPPSLERSSQPPEIGSTSGTAPRRPSPFWGKLPATEHEAQTVADLFEVTFGEKRALLLSGAAATEERLKQELPLHPYEHLATHGFFNGAEPEGEPPGGGRGGSDRLAAQPPAAEARTVGMCGPA